MTQGAGQGPDGCGRRRCGDFRRTAVRPRDRSGARPAPVHRRPARTSPARARQGYTPTARDLPVITGGDTLQAAVDPAARPAPSRRPARTAVRRRRRARLPRRAARAPCTAQGLVDADGHWSRGQRPAVVPRRLHRPRPGRHRRHRPRHAALRRGRRRRRLLQGPDGQPRTAAARRQAVRRHPRQLRRRHRLLPGRLAAQRRPDAPTWTGWRTTTSSGCPGWTRWPRRTAICCCTPTPPPTSTTATPSRPSTTPSREILQRSDADECWDLFRKFTKRFAFRDDGGPRPSANSSTPTAAGASCTATARSRTCSARSASRGRRGAPARGRRPACLRRGLAIAMDGGVTMDGRLLVAQLPLQSERSRAGALPRGPDHAPAGTAYFRKPPVTPCRRRSTIGLSVAGSPPFPPDRLVSGSHRALRSIGGCT